MPTISIRLTAAEKADLESRHPGRSLSDYVREALALRRDVDYAGRMDDFERRLARLEELAANHHKETP